eukprot:Sspe_Gene.119180::Locus_114455_Transcript_1_1_Confidence_1.000_Length_1480::g.119180::m.119180
MRSVHGLEFLGPFLERFGSSNVNARLSVVYFLLVALSNGILLSGTIGLLIKQLTGSVAKVGNSEGIVGACALFPGFIGGYLADKWRRDTVIRVGGMGTFLGSLVLLGLCTACLVSPQAMQYLQEGDLKGIGSRLFLALCVVIGWISASESLSDAASRAIQDDSLETGNRQNFTAKLNVWRNVFAVVGPAMSCLLFLIHGNQWSTKGLLTVVTVGAAVRLPILFICYLFDDDLTLQHTSEAVTEFESLKDPRYVYIPYLYTIARVVVSFGSGMTVKYFPIFFKESLHLSPIAVYIIITLLPLVRVAGISAIHRLARKMGRVPAELTVWVVGTTALMGVSLQGWFSDFSTPAAKGAAVALYLFRCACLQSTLFLQQSVLGDYVPKRTRARWASFSAVVQVGWSGSAVVGGLIIDRYGYMVAFLVTCLFHYLSIAIRAPLLCIVPRWEETVPDLCNTIQHRHRGDSDAESITDDETRSLI